MSVRVAVLCAGLAVALVVSAASSGGADPLRHHGTAHGRTVNRALPPGAPATRHTGAGGPAPLGAAGPPPLGAAGPAPLGAAGPPPLGAAGPPPLGAGGAQPRFIEHEPPHQAPAGCVGEECAAIVPNTPPDVPMDGANGAFDGMQDGAPAE